MRVGIYLCRCGGIISERIDLDALGAAAARLGDVAYVKQVELACGDEGKAFLAEDLRAARPDRMVIAACSPRDHERTFQGVMRDAGLNPYLLQLVNVREQVAWVTPSRPAATAKAEGLLRAALARVRHHRPLEVERLDVSPDVLVIGAGPAGIKAALTVAQAGRRAVLVEKDAILGGAPMRYEEIYPRMECGPCVLEPLLGELLHGEPAARVEVLLQAEVEGLRGSFGNFTARVRRRPRHVSLEACIGCGECIPACPVSYPSPAQCGLGERKAIDFVFFGGLPSAPYVDAERCTRLAGRDACSACRDACTVPGAIAFDDAGATVERTVGAVVVAVGAELYDAGRVPALGYGRVPGVVTSLELERMLSSNGPTGGVPTLPDGRPPASVGIVHCVGSLEEEHRDYCSAVCCMGAFKLNQLVEHKLGATPVTHYYRTLAVAGKEEGALYRKAARAPTTELLPVARIGELSVARSAAGRVEVTFPGGRREHDLLVLMPALVPGAGVRDLSRVLELPVDGNGFFEELHGTVDASLSKVRGIHLAGTCHGPMDLGQAMTQGVAAAGAALSALVPGRQLELPVIHARVDEAVCTACYTCVGVCPYQAIGGAGGAEAAVTAALCTGCGTCVAACPTGAMGGAHFEDAQLMAEIEGVLS